MESPPPSAEIAPPPLAPPQEYARLPCPHCQRPKLRFEARADKGYDDGRAWKCPTCHTVLGVLVVDVTGLTRLRLVAAV